jgi:hypothetical protein
MRQIEIDVLEVMHLDAAQRNEPFRHDQLFPSEVAGP